MAETATKIEICGGDGVMVTEIRILWKVKVLILMEVEEDVQWAMVKFGEFQQEFWGFCYSF